MTAVPQGPRSARSTPAKKPMGGCLIAVIVLLVLSVPAIAILAAIAVPQYHDYVLRSKVRGFVAPRAVAAQAAIAQAKAATGRCPGADALSGALATDVELGSVDGGGCAFRVTLGGLDRRIDGRSLEFATAPDGTWRCSGGTLPDRYRGGACRPDTPETE